jgi:methionyl-tRNA synthetase
VKDTYFVTSAIPYINAEPHVGTAYEIIACDLVARYHRLRGERVFFLTGTDEHSQNVAKAAAEAGITPQEFTDGMVPKWLDVWRRLDVSNDDFIRTSESRHAEPLQRFVQAIYDRGDVYSGTYEGPYCVSCEEFKPESDLVDGSLCPIHLRPVEWLKEENYFFRLSAYQDRLLRLYEEHPEFVQPETRRNEVVAFVKGGLKDLSISRNQTLWGVPLPWADHHVIYVWVDALLNYITAPGYGEEGSLFDRVWPADLQIIGKDIIRFHAVIWPALLMAAGLEVPRTVFAHGFLTLGGEKMSKSRGTGIHPFELIDHFGVDAYRYYFMREVRWGQDGNFSWESMQARYKADLADGMGNLASRILKMVEDNLDGLVPEPPATGSGPLAAASEEFARGYDSAMEAIDLTGAATALSDFVSVMNRYLNETEPWKLAKDPARRDDVAAVLHDALEGLRIIAVFALPVMPGAAARLWEQLGIAEPLDAQRLPAAGAWGGIPPGTKVARGSSLFPQLDD